MFNGFSIDGSSCQMPREPLASFFKNYPCIPISVILRLRLSLALVLVLVFRTTSLYFPSQCSTLLWFITMFDCLFLWLVFFCLLFLWPIAFLPVKGQLDGHLSGKKLFLIILLCRWWDIASI